AKARPANRPLWAFRTPALGCRGNPRLDPWGEGKPNPQEVRPKGLPRNPQGGAGRPIGPRPRRGQVVSRGSRPPQRLRACQAFTFVATPGSVRHRGNRSDNRGTL